MTSTRDTATRPTMPYAAELHAEHQGWTELVTLVRQLSPQERMAPGYYRDPDWSVRDMIGHIGTWLAQAGGQLAQIRAGTYKGHDIDIDGLNAQFLEAMRGQPWDVTWIQCNAAHARMLQEWYDLPEPSDEAAWWIRKAGPEHYDEHLGRLGEWVSELKARRRG